MTNRFIDKVNGIMTDSVPSQFRSLAACLLSVSHAYSAGMRFWRWTYLSGLRKRKRLARPVISIGNLTVGGTGKTPFTICLARSLQQKGYRPAIISRGYKRRGDRRAMIVSDGSGIHSNAYWAGDEPVLMAGALPGVPVVVGSDRFEAGKLAITRFNPDMLLLDDAFQHLRLYRDLDILLMDAAQPLGNGFVFPRGTLREPADAAGRADVVVMTRADAGAVKQHSGTIGRQNPRFLFHTMHKPVVREVLAAGMPMGRLDHGKEDPAAGFDKSWPLGVFAFSALARNETFAASLGELKLNMAGHVGFRDHHNYTAAQLRMISEKASAAGADALATTDKDYVRLERHNDFRWTLPLIVIGVDIAFGADKERWDRFLEKKIMGLAPRQ